MHHARTQARAWVTDEVRGLLARLRRIEPLMLEETMTAVAAIAPRAQRAIELALHRDRRDVAAELAALLRWIARDGRHASSATLQHRLVIARLRFNDVLNNIDLFADALVQRSERDTGLWLAGLDVLATDVLALPGAYEPPPAICFLDRGPGAAIRRARTRLPGGGSNPVALIQIPRERMVGAGVAVSLAHETGHQAAALLDLVTSVRRSERLGVWDRWLPEIVADLWALAKLGPAATLGLIAVVSLPRHFVFRISTLDPHPAPWLRVKLSAALGRALYPDPQWDELEDLWDELYPVERDAGITALADAIPSVAARLVAHRCSTLSARSLGDALALADRTPAALRAVRLSHDHLATLAPSRALAAIGQARFARALTPRDERDLVAQLFRTWAVRRALGSSNP